MSEKNVSVNQAASAQASSEVAFYLLLLALLVIGIVMTLVGSKFLPFTIGLMLFGGGVLIFRKQRVLLAWSAAVGALKG
ncbi:TPA: hypothetical protein I8273_004614 [Aeromonas hydrophila]|nr:hypothetical protein [Aeromonas hydrophila]HAT2639076.1 hypothetical protein [Aeromonas hydrophila]HAT3424240.1 hypothetical protein [Aeromonas hydrophila]HAT3534238.1 hypothetical protein [Aeromonas hydrophila]